MKQVKVKLLTPRDEKMILLYTEEHLTMGAIGAKLGLSRNRVHQVLTALGVKKRESRYVGLVAQLKPMLATNGRNLAKAADALGVSIERARAAAKWAGLKYKGMRA